MRRSSEQRSIRKGQQGAALLLLMLVILLTASIWYLRSKFTNAVSNHRETNSTLTLLRAKEALIARAVTDANRPGSLPCPDLLTDQAGLNNRPNDGIADNLTRNDCPSYVGWLPWATLDLGELNDDSGSRLWYGLSRSLRDDDNAQPINSETSVTLSVDREIDIAAVVIAPRAAINSQLRPSLNIADYLDGTNNNGDDAYTRGNGNADSNDLILPLTRQELMAAVEKRVINEVLHCLLQHGANHGSFPWPSPFTATKQRGQAGSFFGNIPLTQPDSGTQNSFENDQTALTASKTALSASVTPEAQIPLVKQLAEQLISTMALNDQRYTTAKNLALLANSSHLSLSTLDSTLTSAESNGRISNSERSSIQNNGQNTAALTRDLQNQLADSGLDAYPNLLAALSLAVQQQLTSATPSLSQLKISSDSTFSLLSNSTTPNNTLSNQLSSTLNAAANAQLALNQAIVDNVFTPHALNQSAFLKAAIDSLESSISSQRINMHPSEISATAAQLQSDLNNYVTHPASDTISELDSHLVASQNVLNTLSSASSNVANARSGSLNALQITLDALRGNNSSTQISAAGINALQQLANLAKEMTGNGDNMTQTSLKAAADEHGQALITFGTISTPTQAGLVPYAETLRLATVDLDFWVKTINNHATQVATLSRKAPTASKSQEEPDSLYAQAQQTLLSISSSGGTLSKLELATASPSNNSKQTAAAIALTSTIIQLERLLVTGTNARNLLAGNPADAAPITWHGTACSPLQTNSDTLTWWQANQWSNTIFYQISEHTFSIRGKLQVNGAGSNPLIVVSAGKALANQSRNDRRTTNYLEGQNADSSRDGNASTPSRHFQNSNVSNNFNDRLAY